MSENDPDVRIHLHVQGEKTDELTCNWCGIVHPVEPEYKQTFLERTEKQMKDLVEQGATLTIDSAEKAWTCGSCYLVTQGIPPGIIKGIKTECDHPVPDEPQTEWMKNGNEERQSDPE